MTLAEIYAAQGHKDRAMDTLRRVLEGEPEHAAAIRERWAFAFEEWGYDPGPPDEIEVAEAGETH